MIYIKRIPIYFLLLCSLFSQEHDPSAFYNDSWALIIAINDYENVKKLNYAVEDAEDIKELLTTEFGFPEENVELLLNEDATLKGIRQAIEGFAKKPKERDRVILYFAGHGETEVLANGGERGYLLPIDGERDHLFSTALPMNEIKNFSEMTAAKDVLFLMDACYSGLLGVGTRGLSLETNFTLEKMARGGSRQVITAGSKGQVAIEKPEWGNSAFVKNLIKGLKAGMADYNNDGVITGTELGVYLQDKVTQDTGGSQSPNYDKFTNDDGEFIFLYVDTSTGVDKVTVNTSNSNEVMNAASDKNPLLTFGTEGALFDSSLIYNEAVPEWFQNIMKSSGVDKKIEEAQKDVLEKVGVVEEEKELNKNSSFSKSVARFYSDTDGDSDNWVRYNRSEGFYLQLNSTFQSTNIPGSSFYGGIGRAFHKNQYQWIFGYEQLIPIKTPFWTNTVQFYVEGFNKSMTNDAWKISDEDNSLSAFFLSKDYLDWYNGQGFRSAFFVHIINYISIGAEYNAFTQSYMRNVIDEEDYRAPYLIQEGDNKYLKAIISLGYPVDISNRDSFQMYTSLMRNSSLDNSDIRYNKDNFLFNILIPYTDDLNFNIKVMAGASDLDSTTWKDNGFKQNIFEIGGLGTLRGYGWKTLSSSHYALSTFEIYFSFAGIFYDRAVIFESPGNVFNPRYFEDLLDSNLNEDNIYQSIGITFGDSDWNLSFAKQLGGSNETTMYLTTSAPFSSW